MSSSAVDSGSRLTVAPQAPETIGDTGVDTIVMALRHVETSQERLRGRLARQLGLNTAELNALAHVMEARELTPKELAAELGITSGSMTAMSDRLADSGLLVRQPHPTDRRSLLLQLSPLGERTMQWVGTELHEAVALSAGKTNGVCGDAVARFLKQVALELDGLRPVWPPARADSTDSAPT